MKVEGPVVNDFYLLYLQRAWANSSQGAKQIEQYDPVLIHDMEDAKIIGLQGNFSIV